MWKENLNGLRGTAGNIGQAVDGSVLWGTYPGCCLHRPTYNGTRAGRRSSYDTVRSSARRRFPLGGFVAGLFVVLPKASVCSLQGGFIFRRRIPPRRRS